MRRARRGPGGGRNLPPARAARPPPPDHRPIAAHDRRRRPSQTGHRHRCSKYEGPIPHDAEPGPCRSSASGRSESLYRLFHAQAERREPQADDLALLGGFLAEAAPRVALTRIDGGYAWRIGEAGATLAGLLSPVLWSATDLLGGARLAKVKRCANDACQWLFIDDSKNGSRRWCSMSSCGNRAKAYRHYHKAD